MKPEQMSSLLRCRRALCVVAPFAVATVAATSQRDAHGHKARATSLRALSVDVTAGTEASGDMYLGEETAPVVHVVVGSSSNKDSIVSASKEKSNWGFPNYLRELGLGGPQTWQSFAKAHGHLGKTCTVQTGLSACGTGFVCKENVCGECVMSRDCGEHYRCEAPAVFSMPIESGGGHAVHRVCMPRDLIKHWTSWEGFATVLIIITAVLSAAAGMGGGGVYVPLLLLLVGLSTKEAVPLSQAMIVGGATVNIIMFAGDRHPKYPNKPKIDYGVIMMMNPGLAAGVTVGVICNVISPQWLIVVVLIITLAISLEKSLTKGISSWKKESAVLEEQAALANQGGPSAPGAPGAPSAKKETNIKLADFQTAMILARSNMRPLGLVIGCWMTFLVMNLMKAPQCSLMYWAQLAGMMVICAAFTFAGAKTINDQQSAGSEEGMLKWTPRTLWLYPLMSTVAGFLGGFLGIGGGIIMGPLLLELNMAPEASQATTAMFVFLSSSLATIQFIVLGKGMPMYAAWFTSWVILSTFVGQTLVDYFLRKYQRSSVIVLSIAGIIAGSLIMMSCIGAYDVYHDWMRGAAMGFAPHNLCNLGHFLFL